MSKKCRAYSESRLGLEPSDNRKAFYAGWDAALREALASPQPAQQEIPKIGCVNHDCDKCKAQQQQQEPVASLLVGQDSDGRYVSIAAKAHADTLPLGEYKLYTSPPASKPLTDEQLRKVHHEDQFGLFCDYDEFEQIARAIEAAHGITGEK